MRGPSSRASTAAYCEQCNVHHQGSAHGAKTLMSTLIRRQAWLWGLVALAMGGLMWALRPVLQQVQDWWPARRRLARSC